MMIFINGSGSPFGSAYPITFEHGSGRSFNIGYGVGNGWGYGKGCGHSGGHGFGYGYLQRDIQQNYPYELILFKK